MNRLITIATLSAVAVATATCSFTVHATDPRYCGPPTRDAGGRISRSNAVISDFRNLYKCPVTGQHTGACKGWSIDHVVPLACGGCDAVGNMQWLPNQIKSVAGVYAKDRWERKVYATGVGSCNG